MDRSEIVNKLNQNYGAFADFIAKMPEPDFIFSLNGEKWAAGQQLEHLCLSVEPLIKGLKAPEFALKAMFGKADRPSASYDELVARYRDALANGGTAPSTFRPADIGFERKAELVTRLRDLITKLCTSIEKFDENKLDLLLLPHPLIGKLTIREMLYFTIYHAEHHHRHCENNLESKSTAS